MTFDKKWACSLAALGIAACSPALNWREVRPPDSGVVALFPCKPQRLARNVMLAGGKVRMAMSSCSAAGATYALSDADVGDPSKVADALTQLRAAAAGNIGGNTTAASAFTVQGMTPHPLAERVTIEGRKVDGEVVREQAGFFTKGTRVYQAAIVGERIDGEAADTFFTGLKLPP